MRRFVPIVIIVWLLAFSLTGCRSDSTQNTQPTSSTPEYKSFVLTTGLSQEEVCLSKEQKDNLIAMLHSYSWQNRPENFSSIGDVLYGGPYFQLEYAKDNYLYRWSFTVNGISRTTISGETSSEVLHFQSDEIILDYLQNLSNGG